MKENDEKKKILIIEDEVDVSKVLNKRLTDAGFKTVISSDAYQGVEMAHHEHPDLIILDLMLPAGGGLGALKNIKISTHTKLIPVIILTGMINEEYKKEVLAQGVEAYLEKPYGYIELIKTVNNII